MFESMRPEIFSGRVWIILEDLKNKIIILKFREVPRNLEGTTRIHDYLRIGGKNLENSEGNQKNGLQS